MLQFIIPAIEQYDEEHNEFVYSKETVLQLEHSLVSISKWESKFTKPFLTKSEKTTEETRYYVRCMTINKNIDSNIYNLLTEEHMDIISAYIGSSQTATTISNEKKTTNREIVTSELIYYWMINFNIPFECQKWHLNRLLTLINVCNIKTNPPKKMSQRELMARNRDLNAARRAKINSKG